MKKLFFFLFIFFSCNVGNKSRDKADDSIEKVAQSQIANTNINTKIQSYSYQLISYFNDDNNKLDSTIATGFFIRKNRRLFIVSNYHVFTGKFTILPKDSIKFDSIKITYVNHQLEVHHLTINVSRIVKNSRSFLYYEKPDIFCYDVTGKFPLDSIIRSVEVFDFDLPNHDNQANKVFSNGYGDSLNNDNTITMTFMVDENCCNSYQHLPKLTVPEGVFKHSYFLKNQSVSGMSGSPVFFINDSNKTFFAGIISSHFPQINSTLIVKPSVVYKTIDSLLKIRR